MKRKRRKGGNKMIADKVIDIEGRQKGTECG